MLMLSVYINIPMAALRSSVWVVWLLSGMAFCTITRNIAYLLVLLLCLLLISKRNRLGLGSSILPALVFSLPFFLMNVLFVHSGKHVIFRISDHIIFSGLRVPLLFLGGNITWESVYDGFFFSILLIDMFLLFGVFNRMASSDELVKSLSYMASSALTAALILRFIPSVSSDARSVLDAQRSRGLNLARHGPIKRIQLMASLSLPVMVCSLERSLNIAEAMESRGYTRLRTNHYRKQWRKKEILHVGIIAANTLLLINLKMSGLLDAPTLGEISRGFFGVDFLAVLSVLAFAFVTIP